jgi:probable HAF family extracellular repeat protein
MTRKQRGGIMRSRIRLAILATGLLAVASVSFAAEGPGFQLLERLSPADNGSWASDVSRDGSVVVGSSGAGTRSDAFRWSAATGVQPLGTPAGFTGSVSELVVSDDGSTVAASFYRPEEFTVPGRAFRWTPAGGFVSLGSLGGRTGDETAALALSADGSVIVGQSANANGNVEAFRFSATSGMTGMGFANPSEAYSTASGVTPDGLTAVGSSTGTNSNGHHFRWTQQGGLEMLSELPNTLGSQAEAVSDDGKVVVGTAVISFPRFRAYRWTESGGMQLLSDAPGDANEVAEDVSGDGRIVVGNAGNNAFIWDAVNGMRSLKDVLVSQYGLGAELAGLRLASAEAISGDGRTIVGAAANSDGDLVAYRAVLPEPSAGVLLAACAAVFVRRPCRATALPSARPRNPATR